MKIFRMVRYNSPVVLTFALISLFALILGDLTGGKTTALLFCVYRSPLLSPLTYVRLFTHVLGHASFEHYLNNILLMLIVGPPLEEKYGSRALISAIIITAFISGLVQFVFFPGTALLGASGIVFMMIVMSSLAGFKEGSVPLTLILVVIFYLGGEIKAGITSTDNVSQITHVIGGICGAVIGFVLSKKRLRGNIL
ncbi:MAG: rhomboid family intramembrane serine protease [Oscillospiraceae bacterium]